MSWLYSLRNRAISLALAALAVCLTGADEPTYEKLCQQGRKHLLAGEHKQAEQAYSRAAARDTDRQLAHVGLALAYRATGQFKLAIDAANQAIGPGEPDEEDVAALVIRGTARHGRKEYEQAKTDFEKALEFAPNNPSAHAELARVFVELEEGMKARMHFSDALDADPDDHQTYVARGKLYRQQGNLGGAARDFEKACELYPQSAAYRFLLGQARFENREYADALEATKKAIELKDDLSAAYVLKGAILYHLGEYMPAEKSLEKAAEMARMDAGAWLWLGKTRLELGQLDQATKDIEKALDIDKEYVAAHRALADIYEQTERTEEAVQLRQTAHELEAKLRKIAVFGPEFRSDAGPSRLGRTDKFDAATIAAEVLDSRTPSADMITKQVRAAAEQRRRQLVPWQKDLKICEAASVVADPCDTAEENFQKSVDLFKAEDYEVAAYGFEEVEPLYQAALAEFNRVAAEDHELWLNWARQRAEDNLSSDRKANTWTVLAEACHSIGDEEGYRSFIKRAVSNVRARGIANPKDAVNVLLNTAQVQLRCDDRSGAKTSALEAAGFCEGIGDLAPKSFRLARCAGLLARLGETDQWTRHMPTALGAARQVGRLNSSDRVRQPILVQCIAYAEARSAERAFAAAESLESAHRHRENLEKLGALAYSSVVLAASPGRGEQLKAATFDRSYVAACKHLAAFSQVQVQHPDAYFSRHRLALADVRLGQLDRAWASAVNIPDPELRGQVMARVLYGRVDRGEFDKAVAAAEYLPEEPYATEALCRIAEARVRSGKWTMVDLKKWAESRSCASAKAATLSGIAVGVKAGKPVDTKLAPTSDAFDQDAAAAPDWWLDQAAAVTKKVENPSLRAWTWLQLARAQRDANKTEACRVALAEATHCTTAVWSDILDRRPEARQEYDGQYRWRPDQRIVKSEKTDIDGMLRMLVAIEQLQHEIGDSRGAFDTLLLALKCMEPMPRDGGYAAPVRPESLTGWLARLSGRARLRGRQDIATIIFSDLRPKDSSRLRDFERFVQGLAAAEAEDVVELSRLAQYAQQHYLTNRMSERANYAAMLYARLALLAAHRGDENGYREAAMKVGGFVNASRGPASKSVMLQLAEAAAILGEPDVAREYAVQARTYGPEQDAVLAQIAIALVREGRLPEARKLLDEGRDEAARVRSRYAVTKAETSKASMELSAVFQEIDALPSNAEKASALAGVGAALASR